MMSVIDCSKKVLAVVEERNGERRVRSFTGLHDDARLSVLDAHQRLQHVILKEVRVHDPLRIMRALCTGIVSRSVSHG